MFNELRIALALEAGYCRSGEPVPGVSREQFFDSLAGRLYLYLGMQDEGPHRGPKLGDALAARLTKQQRALH